MRRLSLPVLLLSVPLAVPPAVAETVERVIAKVNGQIVTLSDFQARQLDAAQAARVDPANVAAFLRQHNSRILQDAIDEILLLQRAEDAGLKPPEAYLDQVIDQIKKEHNLGSQQEFEAALAEQGLSYSDLRGIIERRLLREMILRRDIEPKMTISDAELHHEYEQLKGSEFTTPAKITLQEIVVKDDAGGEALAQELAAKARAGEDFAALAKAQSAAPTRAHGGEVGEIAENDMEPALRKLVLALPVGGVSQPIRIPDGYRIVKVTARSPAVTIPFDVAAEKLRERAMNARFEKEYDAYMKELRKTAQIELRVREVPLQLTGPIPEGSILEGLDASVSGAPAPAAGTNAQQPAPSAPAVPAGIGDDEIVSSPQTAPQRIAPGGAGAPPPPSERTQADAPKP